MHNKGTSVSAVVGLTTTTTTVTSTQCIPTHVYAQRNNRTNISADVDLNMGFTTTSLSVSNTHRVLTSIYNQKYSQMPHVSTTIVNSNTFPSNQLPNSNQPFLQQNTLYQLMNFMSNNFTQLNNNITLTHNSIASLETQVQNFNTTISRMQEKYDNKIDTINERLNALESIPPTFTNFDNSLIDKISIEILNRQNKSLNLVFFGVHESTDVNQDRKNIINLLKILHLDPNQTKFKRVGSASDNSERPVILITANYSALYTALRNASSLPHGVTISHDKTAIQRDVHNNLRKQIIDHNRMNPNNLKTVRHFNGIPRIVNLRKKNHYANINSNSPGLVITDITNSSQTPTTDSQQHRSLDISEESLLSRPIASGSNNAPAYLKIPVLSQNSRGRGSRGG